MFILRIFIHCIAHFLLLLISSSIAAPIIIGGDHNYPPYEFLNDNNEPDGYNTELTKAIANVMGIEVDIRLGNWEAMRNRLSNGQIDLLQGMAYSNERSEFYDFSPSHALIHQSIFSRNDTQKINNISQLEGKNVIVQQGGIMHDYLVENDIDATLYFVDTHVAALRLLSSGMHDYALVANLPGLYFEKELELSNLVSTGTALQVQNYGYAVIKGNIALLAQFSEGLAILKNTGRYQAIYEKWFGPLEEQGIHWQKIGYITGAISAILLLTLGVSVIWNRTLTKEVSRRTQELAFQQQQLIHADKMTSLGVLVSGVAHEINNPSSLLLLNLPVIKEFYADSNNILEAHYQSYGDFYVAGLQYSQIRDEIPLMLDDMQKGAQKIRRIVDDLQDFSREGTNDFNEFNDLNDIVKVVIRLVDNTIQKSCNHFNVSYSASLPTFYGNAQKVEQVIINLIVNACQALESPEQAIKVRTFINKANQICCEVLDQGKGINSADIARLSDPFFTTRREEGGTGLGLFVSRKIVQEHKGHLVYESTLAIGTKATLILPVKHPSEH